MPEESKMPQHECPRCGATSRITVAARVWAELTSTGLKVESQNVPFSGPFFDDDDEMHCGACGYDGKVFDFAKEGGDGNAEQLEFDLFPSKHDGHPRADGAIGG